MTRRNQEEPTRWADDPTTGELGALLRKTRFEEGPGPGARERAWRRMTRAPARSPRSVLWIPASAVALVIVVGGAFWVARSQHPDTSGPIARTSHRLSTPPAQSASLRFGAFDVHLGANTLAEITEAGDDLSASLHHGELAVRRADDANQALATVALDAATIEGADFSVRRAPDGAWNVDAASDDVYVRTGDEVVRLSRGQRWPQPPGATDGTVVPVPSDVVTSDVEAGHEGIAQPPTLETPPVPDSVPRLAGGPARRVTDAPPTPMPAATVATGATATAMGGQHAHGTDDAEWAEARRLVRSGDPSAALARLEAIANGGGSHAELALYESGRVRVRFLNDPAGARRDFLFYRQRYPHGALRLEADLSVIETLVAQTRSTEALVEANAFLAAHPSSERSAEVRFIRANLLRDAGRWLEARADYLQLASAANARAGEALFQAAVCDQALGEDAQARARLESYLKRFADGARRAEVERALGR